MLEVGMHEAKSRLSELVRLMQQGEEIYLTNHGVRVAELNPPREMRKQKAAETIARLRKLAKEHPLGTFDELMAWRREGLR